MIKSILVLLFLVQSASVFAEELITRTIQLNYRQADDVVSLLKPFLHPDGVMTPDNYKIHVKTSPKNFQDLQQLIAEIDVSMRQLKVSVTLNGEMARRENMLNNKPQTSKNSVVSESSLYSTDSRNNSNLIQHVTVVEGKWANISAGETVPVGQRVQNPDGTVTEQITYRSVNSSYQVLPRITGEKVTLFIRPQIQQQSEYSTHTKTRSAETTVMGSLNQWILIGGTSHIEVNQPGSRVYSTQESSQSQNEMFVKVEVVQ